MTKPGCTDIETQVGEQLKGRAILEPYDHHLELMPILTCRSESLGLVLYNANGYLLLPDGREYPDQETQDEITAYWRQREAEEQKWRQENRWLPKNIKDFYKYSRPKVDELMARYGFEYAPICSIWQYIDAKIQNGMSSSMSSTGWAGAAGAWRRGAAGGSLL